MSKSGEILRIGHGNYSFLCSHCGFNFHDINEILAHIDYHFDIPLESKGIYPDDTTVFHDIVASTVVREDIEDRELQKSSIQTEFIKIEDSPRETKTYAVDELPLDVKLIEDAAKCVAEVSSSKINRKKVSATTSRGTATKSEKVKEVVVDDRSCPICESNFDSSTDYKRHLRDVHHIANRVFQCYICGWFCKSVHSLKRHLDSGLHSRSSCYQCESQPPVRNEWEARPHKCCLCSLWFENHVQFRKHFKDIHQEDVEKFFTKRTNCTQYTCYVCKKDFLHKYYLRNHMIVHDELKAFVCDVCGKCYRTKTILKRHLNVHEGKTYTCDQCGKQFPYYARLRIHTYSHRTELNYKCTVCSKAFKVQKYLARHMKVHQEEKAYACKYCGKRFTFSTGRRAHEISQHNAI